MAASGYTPVQLYRSTTPTQVPSAGNLADGELAINIYDKKLYAKDSTGTVFLLASEGGTSGTVSTVSVVSANGFAGTVANATTTPAITLTTSITGVLKGNGTAISAATAGTDYVAPGGALGTPSSGTVTNLTGTASININGTVGATTPTTGVFTQVDTVAEGPVRWQDASGGQYVAFKAPATVASSVTWTLPSADGSNGQALVTDGSGTLSFGTAGITTGKSIAMAMIFGF